MTSRATPETPVEDAAENVAAGAEPAWIEVGSPKRRTGPPAWSDEIPRDAWDGRDSADQPEQSDAPARFEVMEVQESADGDSAQAPEGAAAADGDDADRDDATADEVVDAADEDVSGGAQAPASDFDVWVQEAAEAAEPDEPAEPAEHTENTAPAEPADQAPPAAPGEDPESGDRWQVVSEQAPAQPSDETAVLSPTAAAAQSPLDLAEDSSAPAETAPTAPIPLADDPASRSERSQPHAPRTEPRTKAFPVPIDDLKTMPKASPTMPNNAVVADAPQADAQEPPHSQSPPAQAPHSPVAQPQVAPARETTVSDETDGTDSAAPTTSAEAAEPRKAGTLSGALDLVLPHLAPYRGSLIAGLIALVLSVWSLVALPFPLKYSIDAALAAAGAGSTAPDGIGADPSTALFLAAGALAVLVAAQAGFRALSVSALNRMGARVATDLRGRLLNHLHRLSPGRDIDDLGRSASPLIEDVARLRDLVSHTGPRIVTGLLALASLLIMLLVIEPLAAAIVLVTAALTALAARAALAHQRRREAAAAADELLLAETADELLSATRTIQSYGLEERAAQSLGELGARTGGSRSAARRSAAVGSFLTELITGLGVGAALLLGGWRMNAGTMTPGELTMVVAAVLIAVLLAREVVRHSVGLRATIAAGDRVGELLEHRAAITEPGRSQQIGALRGEVVYSALSAQGRRGPLFDGVSLVIPAGQHVALVGRDGDEASALLSYLLRFDQPDSGRVLLDRYDTRELSLADLRRGLAVVQRESALFSESVRENIRVGRPGATDDEIVEAARRSGADEFITLLPDGYDTHLSRRGAALTDGQRRAIAITRALLRDAPVVLLDDADADLAPAERDLVQRALAALTDGRTTLLSSQEPETILAADRVLCFESGVLAEDGAPAQLAEDPDSWLSLRLNAGTDPR